MTPALLFPICVFLTCLSGWISATHFGFVYMFFARMLYRIALERVGTPEWFAADGESWIFYLSVINYPLMILGVVEFAKNNYNDPKK